ncbi:MAG: PIG-L deacetylase family protein [Candidatus Paceibacterota bacterium]|jgi:LmbE family N-acetylglucosaminyl deacetylase
MHNILVIAPHPDDEVLGCAGTIRKYANKGASVHVCIVTKAYEPEWSAEFIRNRPNEVRRVADILGSAGVSFLDFPTVELDTVPQRDISKAILAVIQEIKPDKLYIPHHGDLNRDHQLVHEAALVAARPTLEWSVARVLAYETPSETEWGVAPFLPNTYEDITETLQKKLEAMQVYASEVRSFPHLRSLKSLEALAIKRGSEICRGAAEAFMLLRSIQ